MGVYVPVSAVFPDVHADFETLSSIVRGLSRTDTLFWCARLNLILSNPENPNGTCKQQYAIDLFFDSEEVGRINQFASKHGGADNVHVFLRAQLLELARWTCLLAVDHVDDGVTFENRSVRHRFAQAAMIASDLWAERVYQDKVVSTGNQLEDRRRAISAFRESVSANRQAVELMQVLARGVSIYRESFQRGYRSASDDFFETTGLTLDRYMTCLSLLTIHFARIDPANAEKNSGGFRLEAILSGLSPDLAASMDRFIHLESQTADELREALWPGRNRDNRLTGIEPFDLKPLRERPLLRTTDGRVIILDTVFFSDQASVGPLFTLVKAVCRRGGAVNSIFGAFGSAFESYVNWLLRGMYPAPSPPLLDRLVLNPHAITSAGNDVEVADALLLDIADAVFFEAKGIFVREDVAHAETIDAYLSELRKKLGVGPGSRNDRASKGAGQLARHIGGIAVNEVTLMLAESDWRPIRTVYPVLVVYDVTLNSHGHAEFFEAEFREALQPEEMFRNGYMKKGGLTVAPLIVMTIEDLEGLESSVQNFRLLDLLREYASTSHGGVRVSLHDFMALVQQRYRFIHSKQLAERAYAQLEEIWRKTFPDVPMPDEKGH